MEANLLTVDRVTATSRSSAPSPFHSDSQDRRGAYPSKSVAANGIAKAPVRMSPHPVNEVIEFYSSEDQTLSIIAATQISQKRGVSALSDYLEHLAESISLGRTTG